MGDAYTAYDVGFESVYYNPAGVAKPTKPQIKIFDFEGLMSAYTYGLIVNNYASITNMQAIIKEVTGAPGTVYSLGFNFLPQFLVKNFSIGLIGRNYSEAYFDGYLNELNFYAFNDVGIYSQIGAAFFGGILKIGIGAKFLDRAEINKAFTQAEYSTGSLQYANQWQEGVGTGFDAGILLTAPTSGLPTLGVAIQDIGNTVLTEHHAIFSSNLAQPGNPPPLLQKVNAGFSLQSKQGRGNKIFFSVEAKDVLRLTQGAASDHLHAGIEADFNHTLYFRAGVNQGRYWTAGIGLHIGHSGLELASYGENVGFNGKRVDDRKSVGRYVQNF